MSVSPPSSTAPLRSAMKQPPTTSRSTSPTSISPPTSPIANRHPLPTRPHTRSRPSTESSTRPSVTSHPSQASTSTSTSTSTQSTVPIPPAPFSPTTSMHGYTPKVSFDTFEDPAAAMFSFTLGVKSDGYARTRSTRVFLCASSPDESGREALDWALESLVQDGDELIVCRGIDQEELGELISCI